MKTSQRTQRLAELIKRYLAQILLAYRDNPYISKVTISDVEVTVDLSIARVFFTVFEDKNVELTLHELQREVKNIRHLLARNLNLRVTPRLHFVYDYSVAEARKLDDLIDAAVK